MKLPVGMTAIGLLALALALGGCGRKVPVLGPGGSYETTFRGSDLDTGELDAEVGLTEGDLRTAMTVAKPDNCVDGMGNPAACYEFSQYGCRWLVMLVDNPGTATVRATGTRDYMMICEAPDGTLFGNDDFDTLECTGMGLCDPGMTLDGAGTWTCLFTVSPYETIFYPTNGPTGGDITVTVEP